MSKVSLQEVQKLLKGKDYDVQLQKETDQLYIILKHEGIEFPLFIRIFDESELLQLLVFMPCNIKDEARGDLARLLHLLNKELDIPGFGMDETANVCFFRCMIPTPGADLNETVLDAFLRAIDVVCKTFAPAVVTVASGNATFEEVLKKAQEQQGKK